MENLPLENNLSNSNSYASDRIRVCYSTAKASLRESPDSDLELENHSEKHSWRVNEVF